MEYWNNLGIFFLWSVILFYSVISLFVCFRAFIIRYYPVRLKINTSLLKYKRLILVSLRFIGLWIFPLYHISELSPGFWQQIIIMSVMAVIGVVIFYLLSRGKKDKKQLSKGTPFHLFAFLLYGFFNFIASVYLGFVAASGIILPLSRFTEAFDVASNPVIGFILSLLIYSVFLGLYKIALRWSFFVWILISPPLFAAIGIGWLAIFLKYRLFRYFSYTLLCGSCFRLNKRRDSFRFEAVNYYNSFSYKSMFAILQFDRDLPEYKKANGQLKFGSGRRFCKFCGSSLTEDGPYITLKCFFGDRYAGETTGGEYLLENPEVSDRTQIMDLSSIVIDTATADRLKLERFITFIINFPPKTRLRKLPVYYIGELDTLGEPTRNLVVNTFGNIRELDSD
ncbi:MAG: hypothetical protein JW969_00215 [Spirochaetales bacterium]|nr:hypothetical protein [Spirochaetales bacterium]